MTTGRVDTLVKRSAPPAGPGPFRWWMSFRIVRQVIELQILQTLKQWGRLPVLITLAVLGLAALYILNLQLVLPAVNGYLVQQYLLVQQSFGAGSGGGLFYLALLHLAGALIPAGAYFNQATRILELSVPLRIVHQRVRSPRCVALVLQAECLAMALVFELLFFPLLWQPFLAIAEDGEIARLIGFKLLLLGVTLCALTLFLALRQHHLGRGGGLLGQWLAVAAYYLFLLGLGYEVQRTFRAPSPDHLFTQFLRAVRTLVTSDSVLLLYGPHLVLWLALIPAAGAVLAKVIRRHGL